MNPRNQTPEQLEDELEEARIKHERWLQVRRATRRCREANDRDQDRRDAQRKGLPCT